MKLHNFLYNRESELNQQVELDLNFCYMIIVETRDRILLQINYNNQKNQLLDFLPKSVSGTIGNDCKENRYYSKCILNCMIHNYI
jgi:hypothetical protein